MIYGYCRVSTYSQKDNTSLESQAGIIFERYPDAIIIEEVFSGAKKRKKFETMIENLQPGDLVCSTKLDRFCRNTREGLRYADEILSKGASLHIIDVGMIDNSPTGQIILAVLLAVAEFERSRTVERCREGKEIAKQNPNFRDGRPPKFSRERIETAIALTEEFSLRQVEEKTGISVSTIKRYKRKMKINGNSN